MRSNDKIVFVIRSIAYNNKKKKNTKKNGEGKNHTQDISVVRCRCVLGNKAL